MRKPGVSRGTRNMVVPSRSGTLRIGARVDEEQLADRRVGDEAFLAVEDPFVAMALGAQLEARLRVVGRRQPVVGAGARLGDALAEQEGVVGDERLEEALLLLVGAGRRDQMAPLPVLAEGLRDRAVAAASSVITSAWVTKSVPWPPYSLRHRHGAEAELRALLDDVPVEGLARIGNRVARERDRADLLLGELARRHLPVRAARCSV